MYVNSVYIFFFFQLREMIGFLSRSSGHSGYLDLCEGELLFDIKKKSSKGSHFEMFLMYLQKF